jgi:hypothetical protein
MKTANLLIIAIIFIAWVSAAAYTASKRYPNSNIVCESK